MTRPLLPADVNHWVGVYVEQYSATDLTATNGQKGAMRKHLVRAFPDERQRHLVYGFIFNGVPAKPMRTSEFTNAQWFALKRWIGVELNTEGEWIPNESWPQECEWLLWQLFSESPYISGGMVSSTPVLDTAVTELGAHITSVEQVYTEPPSKAPRRSERRITPYEFV